MYIPDNKARPEPVNNHQKLLMLSTIIRVDKAFRSAKSSLTPEHFFSEDDLAISILWRAALEFNAEFEQLPTKTQLLTQTQAVASRLGSSLDDDDFDHIGQTLDLIYDLSEGDLDPSIAGKIVQKVLGEALQEEATAQMQRASVEDIPELLRATLRKAHQISAMNSAKLTDPFADGLGGLDPIVTESTGVSFLDAYMGGGSSPGEVYGFCGPYGSCKTTLAVMLAVERAIFEQKLWVAANKEYPLPLVYLVVWEEEQSSLRLRAASYAARVSRKSLIGADFQDGLSTTGNLKGYEQRLFRSKLQLGETVKGETERLDLKMRQLGRNLRFVDFTGAEVAFSAAAANMAEGVADVIRNDQEENDMPGVATIVMDYAGAAARRSVEHKGLNPDTALRHLVGGMPLSIKHNMAIPFDCPVWIFHQLGTESNSKSSATVPKVTDMAEARNFYENANFGFMVGVPTPESNCVFACVKARRSERMPSRILSIDGDLCRVDDTNGRYLIHNNMIVESDYRNSVVDSLPEPTGQPTAGDRALFNEDIGVS